MNKLTSLNRLALKFFIYFIVFLGDTFLLFKFPTFELCWLIFTVLLLFIVCEAIYKYMEMDKTIIGDEYMIQTVYSQLLILCSICIVLLVINWIIYYYFNDNILLVTASMIVVAPLVSAFIVLGTFYSEKKSGVNNVILGSWQLVEYEDRKNNFCRLGGTGLVDSNKYTFRLRKLDAYKINFETNPLSIDFYNSTNRVANIEVLKQDSGFG